MSPSTSAIRGGLQLTQWTTQELWLAAAGIGGELDQADVDRIASGRRAATRAEHDVLAAAFNDHLLEHGQDHPVRFWHEL